MTHTYHITGMTCSGCESKVKNSLLSVPDVTEVEVSKEGQSATITMDKHVDLLDLEKHHESQNYHHQLHEDFLDRVLLLYFFHDALLNAVVPSNRMLFFDNVS